MENKKTIVVQINEPALLKKLAEKTLEEGFDNELNFFSKLLMARQLNLDFKSWNQRGHGHGRKR